MIEQQGLFIAIAGNIGAGKSTLTSMLSTEFGWEPFYEANAENPYLADFYQDMATIYEDLIRPRKTRTQEELKFQLDEIKERADQLKVNSNNLLTMDMDLRRTFRVHQPKRTDALRRYVENK